jgi:integrase
MTQGKFYSPYLYRRGGLWYFRWTYPRLICEYLGKRELRLALKTGYQREATHQAISLAARMQLFRRHLEQEAAMQSITAEQAQVLLDHYLHEALADRERWRYQSEPLTAGDVEAELSALRYIQQDTQRELMHHQYGAATRQVESVLAEAGIQLPHEPGLQHQLARQMLLTDARLVDLEIRRTQGDYITPAPTGYPASSSNLPLTTPRKLSVVIEEFIAEQVQADRWTDKTHQAVEAMMRDLIDITGDLPVAMMTKDVLRNYKQTLVKLPPNRRKVKRYRNKTIREIIAMDNVTPIAVKTVNDTLTTVSQLFGWALDQGYVSANPVKGLLLPDLRRDDEQRNAFDPAQLTQIFLCEEFRAPPAGRQPNQFWLPILGLFTGARIEELASLKLDDVKDVGGVTVIDINTDAGKKRLKTKNALRQIALHPTVLELGFLDYVKQRRQQGHGVLFPELLPRRGGRKGIAPSRWFARYLDRRGITGKEYVFHSFRHCLIDALKQADVPETLVKEIAGHQSGGKSGSVTFGRYGKRLRPDVQLAHLRKVDFGIDLRPLTDVWPKLLHAGHPT